SRPVNPRGAKTSRWSCHAQRLACFSPPVRAERRRSHQSLGIKVALDALTLSEGTDHARHASRARDSALLMASRKTSYRLDSRHCDGPAKNSDEKQVSES